MKTLLKMAAYGATGACVGGVLGLIAWGISYGATGKPTFHDNAMLVMAVFYGSAILGIAAFVLHLSRPWES